jgi:hypothetical protein
MVRAAHVCMGTFGIKTQISVSVTLRRITLLIVMANALTAKRHLTPTDLPILLVAYVSTAFNGTPAMPFVYVLQKVWSSAGCASLAQLP